ncbi:MULTISPECIES: IS4 family transposase [unclassified Microcoleus]|uniref:IS4 family transposase n=1 Tax=unclassified Microcoleus TaxID=2642155 RepID=UPI001D898533|nr:MULTISPECIES: IS4 family transposase [unclassified Microcoleus]MCC3436800.1 IS4 family transposase [Microcoleus sp. PH2017_05_CCC_O_A]MCC3588944.1 IS4 family transposase [Microcoleus sp. PH2017_30_WIL_O_A]TAG44242.1 MAG: IS4 family transposase [Oscillatoriales cyanobacterium]
MIPTFYQTHLKKQLTKAHFLVMTTLLSVIQSEKQVRLERLARVFPYPITTESRRRKIQRFLDLPSLTISLIWFPLITYWLTTYCCIGTRLSIAIDRSQWGCINLFMVSLIWEKRAIPLYWSLLPKLGNSNLEEQTTNLEQILPLFSEYKVIVLGDREFCSVDLGNWLREKGVSFCLRLKKNHCIETEHLVWQRLDELGIVPGTSLYFQGKRVRKTQPATGFDVACKWKRNYGAWKVDEAWFILTDLGSLSAAIDAYKQRMGIEEMFRDCKTGGYDLEGTSLKGDRLINMILLMTLAYSSGIFQGTEMRKKQVQKYVSRRKEPKKRYRRRSTFGVGLDGEKWVNYLEQYSDEVEQLMKLSPNKRRFYQQGMRAATLIQSIS